ncbi:MAG TPA: proline dehydrogenase family protein [Desulfuromonadaceae bacterium]|jgi:RHH-type proline utilization regulon transcriptional repressor/proline dehydrogenase/delta 1-pyrroline-5-carboxylate dehydrogenase
MDDKALNSRIINRGRQLFAAIATEHPAMFEKGSWTGAIMNWCMQDERFKTQLFRFVDVFPSLTSPKLLADHLHDYFGPEQDLPPLFSKGAKLAGALGSLGGAMLHATISSNIRAMAGQFIIGETTSQAVKRIERLRKEGYAVVLDVLGEATLSREEAEDYLNKYMDLLGSLKAVQGNWPSLSGNNPLAEDPALDWGQAPKINVSIKPSALYSQANPQDFEGSVEAILYQMRRIAERVYAVQGFLCIDMESYKYKDITLEVYRRLKLEYKDYPHIGIVLQAYLRDTDQDLAELLDWARQHNTRISIRLVKGAYWDYETIRARQMGWDVPVWTIKADTDAAFERQARRILENSSVCHFACASHNIRSISAVIEIAEEMAVPPSDYEFQMLYGMAEPVRKVILAATGRLRLYCPYGNLVPGMGYLVRRLLENTANQSFLRLSFSEQVQVEQLLEDPLLTASRERSQDSHGMEAATAAPEGLPDFVNQAMVDFTQPAQRAAFPQAIALARSRLGRSYPLFIGNKDITTGQQIKSLNPSRPSEVLGLVCQAGIPELEQAIAAAKTAFPAWRDTPPVERAAYLLSAARIAERRIFEFSAWQVLEAGKQWEQAYADVAEAIDFLEYYAREMIRLAQPQRLGLIPGELNQYFYEPRGPAAVIAPWNFPLAISMGMVSAALVTGNPVIYKPSNLTPIIGHQLVEIFREAGLPAGVFNYFPGQGSSIGDRLVDHPAISLVAFTGSLEVGLRIIERSAPVHPGQAIVKRVVCEMGGKNAIIIDDDADLDEAVPQVLASAFGFQGQKCSACSRVIVLDAVYERFVGRLVKAAQSWQIGPAEEPAFNMGAVIDNVARDKIREYIAIGKQEGVLLYESGIPAGEGNWVPLTIIGGIQPQHRLAQEEVFGPVLAVMRVKDFSQAISWANSTRFALTGGIFSRSPSHLERARGEYKVGNLYINRGITGALVGRQPFGGVGLSGVGTKAGGPDYLLHFMDPRVVTENTMRRGFAPAD